MFEAAVLLSHVKKLRTTGVAAALQSGGACTLFAEAAGARRGWSCRSSPPRRSGS